MPVLIEHASDNHNEPCQKNAVTRLIQPQMTLCEQEIKGHCEHTLRNTFPWWG